MVQNENTGKQDEVADNEHIIANMDELDYVTLLIESRIIQAS